MTKKRMLCLISDQVLPNFIAVNEPATRPEALHGIFTHKDANMKQRWENLKKVVAAKFPEVKSDDVPIEDAYDAREIQQKCASLLERYSNDKWVLNATGGTKLMSAAASEVFHRNGCDVYYVESWRNRTLKLAPDWQVEPVAFEKSLDVKTYFQLYGRDVSFGSPQNTNEEHAFRQLELLDWGDFKANVGLKYQGGNLFEYDAVGVRYYQCFVFERKKLSDHRGKKDVRDEILIDLLKLYQAQQHFGGPFGKSYWIFSGEHQLNAAEEERIRLFKITPVLRNDINRIVSDAENLGLPPRRQ